MSEHPSAPPIVWTPTPDLVADSNIATFARWLRKHRGLDLDGYDAMWEWSTTDLAGFWSAIWEHYDVGAPVGHDQVLTNASMPGATWFRGAHVNFAEFVLRHRAPDDQVAIVTAGESDDPVELTWGELRRQVAALAQTMRDLGVVPHDVVVGYLPNIAESVVACLATTSLGAIWSCVGQDYAPEAAIKRFAQLEPRLLFTADGHWFAGKPRDHRGSVEQLRAGLPTIEHVIAASRLGLEGGVADSIAFAVATAGDVAFSPVTVPFDHPLWVLFSSGTTGLPKGMVHSHGGIVVEHVKSLKLTWDLKAEDRMLLYTSPSWMVWNVLLGALCGGGSIVCYDGAPMAPDASALWKVVAGNRVTLFATSPGYLGASQDQGIVPRDDFDLTALRIMAATGSPLPDHSNYYVAENVRVPLFSMTGGTDVAGSFANGSINVPVWAGELSVRSLGVRIEAWDAAGRPQVNQVGELVVTAPMPSMPTRFWDDPDGSKYHAAYFDTFPGVWRHGDWITITDRGSVIVHGRSDSTLNRHGVRMGSADIYAAVESMDEVAEALVLGVEEPDAGYWMPLFVVLHEGYDLTDDLVARMTERIRTLASPRHVPDEVRAVAGIPHTRTGKKLEVPVKRLIQGGAFDQVVSAEVVDVLEHMQQFEAIAAERRLVLAGRRAAV